MHLYQNIKPNKCNDCIEELWVGIGVFVCGPQARTGVSPAADYPQRGPRPWGPKARKQQRNKQNMRTQTLPMKRILIRYSGRWLVAVLKKRFGTLLPQKNIFPKVLRQPALLLLSVSLCSSLLRIIWVSPPPESPRRTRWTWNKSQWSYKQLAHKVKWLLKNKKSRWYIFSNSMTDPF